MQSPQKQRWGSCRSGNQQKPHTTKETNQLKYQKLYASPYSQTPQTNPPPHDTSHPTPPTPETIRYDAPSLHLTRHATPAPPSLTVPVQIGRASCRDSVSITV